MREIKFRAWNKLVKKFTYFGGEASIEESIDNQKLGMFLEAKNTVFISQYEEPQIYTGLKDKNGKEIYEGDVVRLYRPGIKENLYAEVKFIDGCFDVVSLVAATLGRDYLKCYVINRAVEVKGNIYENSELLEPKEADCLVCPYTEANKCSNCCREWNKEDSPRQHKEFILKRFNKVE